MCFGDLFWMGSGSLSLKNGSHSLQLVVPMLENSARTTPQLPSVLAYGVTQTKAAAKVELLDLRVIDDKIDPGT